MCLISLNLLDQVSTVSFKPKSDVSLGQNSSSCTACELELRASVDLEDRHRRAAMLTVNKSLGRTAHFHL